MSTPVSDHAVRRYAERKLGLYAAEGLSDPEYVAFLSSQNIDVPALRNKLSSWGDLGQRHGAPAVIVEGVKVVIRNQAVVTVLGKGMHVTSH